MTNSIATWYLTYIYKYRERLLPSTFASMVCLYRIYCRTFMGHVPRSWSRHCNICFSGLKPNDPSPSNVTPWPLWDTWSQDSRHYRLLRWMFVEKIINHSIWTTFGLLLCRLLWLKCICTAILCNRSNGWRNQSDLMKWTPRALQWGWWWKTFSWNITLQMILLSQLFMHYSTNRQTRFQLAT